MWSTLYSVLTARAGMYICYLAPIIYLIGVVAHIVKGKQTQQKRLGIGDVLTILALVLISVDFGYYGYLFFSHTGKLLQPNHLFFKYVGGGLLWVWILGYCYQMYFASKAAGDRLKARYMQLIWVLVGSLVLGGVGILIS